MRARRIVKHLDAIEDFGPSLETGSVELAGNPLDFYQREEIFHRRVIPNLPAPTHPADDVMLVEQSPEMFTGVLSGFNRSSQYYIVEQISDARPAFRSVSSNPAFCEALNSVC